jgi:hypothetical protein
MLAAARRLRQPPPQGDPKRSKGLLGAYILHPFRVMIDRHAGRLTLVAIQPDATIIDLAKVF